MKKNQRINVIVATILLAAMVCSCQNEEQRAKKVAEKYSYYMALYDLEQATPYVTEETKISTMAFLNEIIGQVDSNYIKADKLQSISIESIEIKEDTIAIATFHKITDLKDVTGEVELRKRGNKWLVHNPMRYIQEDSDTGAAL